MKKRVVGFKSTNVPGSDEWVIEARNVPANEDVRIVKTREAFITYLKKIKADEDRFTRERARIADIINHLVAEKTSEERAKGVEQPNINPKNFWPNLVKINEPDTLKNLLLTGAGKR
jgi:hypothetical protein